MTTTVSGSQITFNDNSTQNTAAKVGMVNRIINGAMVIDQRNAGASKTVTDTVNATYTLDRWAAYGSQASKFSVQQNAATVTPPAGFINYLGVTSLSAYTVGSAETFLIYQNIEGFNTADLGWGAAGASTVTLSFWVRSSLTGTFGGSLTNNATNRSYPFSYTISSANTWEQKTVTIAGDTSGTWLTNSSTGISLRFSLGTGSTLSGTANTWAGSNYIQPTSSQSVVGTNGATFYITGVQLEKGSTATSFDYRPYGAELNLCLRYFWKWDNSSFSYQGWGNGPATSATAFYPIATLPVPMRTTPSISTSAASTFRVVNGSSVYTPSTTSLDGGSPYIIGLGIGGSGFTTGTSYFRADTFSTAYVLVSAEL